jgi:hypothetical protein
MTLEADYFRGMFRRMRRMLWGPGVACGANVTLVPLDSKHAATHDNSELWKVLVTSGYIFGPYGDEIIIGSDRIVDVRGTGVIGFSGDGPATSGDPWSAEPGPLPKSGDRFIAVKYAETMTRPVRAQPVGCGCDDSQCEYSRLCDGYELGVLANGPPTKNEISSSKDTKSAPCPDHPSDPWVYLAKVTVMEGGKIQIDSSFSRQLVASWLA